MTKKITKGLISLGFLAVGLSMIVHGQIGRGGATITLAIAGMYWVEYREAMRYFDSILQRIFVCVSFDTVEDLAENLSKQMLNRHISKEVSAIATLLMDYYAGEFEAVRGRQQTFYLKRMKRWQSIVSLHAAVALGETLDDAAQARLKRFQAETADPIEQRMIQLLMLKTSPLTMDAVTAMRKLDNTNLHTAELCKIMATLSEQPNRQYAYQKSANNLAPKTYLYQSMEEV